jgi:hypothetical protein
MNPDMDRPKRVDHIRVRRQEQETAIFNILTAEYVILNVTGGTIWDLCDGNRTVSAISAELRSRCIDPPDEQNVLNDVIEVIDVLHGKQLVEMVVG